MAIRVRPISPSSAARLALASDEQLVASIREDDPAAFEALYERHSRELLSFCLYMLSSRADAEEALQVTFASAYGALLADERPVALRAWLFTIARNQCLSILRRRRPTVELNGESALVGDPFRELELREEVRSTLAGVRGLPERQRAAMVMAELHGLSQAEIGGVLGLRPDQVKALVYQARSNLISERRARDTDCHEIRAELASARGAALLKGRLRRHVRACPDCRTYADGVARQRRGIGALLPFAPWLTLKFRALQEALTNAGAEPVTYAGGTTLGGTVAGAALFAGGSIKAIAVKVAAGAALLGLSTGLGAPVMSAPSVHHSSASALVAKPAWLRVVEGGGGSRHGHHGAAQGAAGGALGAAGGTTLVPGGSGSAPPSLGIDGSAEGASGGGGGTSGGAQRGGSGAGAHAAPAAASTYAAKRSHVPARRLEHGAQQQAAHEQGAARREEGELAQQRRQLEKEQRQSSPGETLPVTGETGGSSETGHARTPRTEAERLEQQQQRQEREELRRSQHRQHKREAHQRSLDKTKRVNEHKHASAKRQAGREKNKKQAESHKHREEARREHERNKRRKSQAGHGVEAEAEIQ